MVLFRGDAERWAVNEVLRSIVGGENVVSRIEDSDAFYVGFLTEG